MNNKQKLNKQIKFREENETMNKLNNKDYKNIEDKLNYDHIVNGKKHIKKNEQTITKTS